MSQRTLLLNPGPVTLTERVRTALQREDMCHREAEFAELCISLKQRLSSVYDDSQDYESILLTGSGSCAVEAMINSLAPQKSTTLVVANGVYGERIANMLRAANRPCIEVKGEWQEAMDLSAAEEAMRSNADITHVVAVHNETTTGRLNDISSLAAICKNHNKALMIDAVSSFGGEHIDFTNWQPIAVAATANKCLHAIPGMAFVLVQKDQLEQTRSQAQTLYLDLFAYAKAQKSGFLPFTQSVQAAFALDEALHELQDQGGWQNRHKRYQQLSHQIQEVLPSLGMPLFLKANEYSSMITSFHLPENWDYDQLHGLLKAQGFVIYAGQGDLQKILFRIANMGDLHDSDWERLISIFSELVSNND